jgi:hypothetical protein
VIVRCCEYAVEPSTSCPNDEYFTCIRRKLADGGVEFFQDPYWWVLAPGFAKCDQSAISQAVADPSAPTCK